MDFKEGSMKCDGCGQDVPETSTGSCLGYRMQDTDILERLNIVKSHKQLLRICSFEGSNWFCKECLDRHCFCKSCQEETTPDERQKIFEDL